MEMDGYDRALTAQTRIAGLDPGFVNEVKRSLVNRIGLHLFVEALPRSLAICICLPVIPDHPAVEQHGRPRDAPDARGVLAQEPAHPRRRPPARLGAPR